MRELAVQVENLGKRFRLGVGAGGTDTLRDALARGVRTRSDDIQELWALRGLNLEVARGEALGIIGHNGAGKTTLLRILARITNPTEGVARTRGTVGSLLDVGTGFHGELTGRENVYLSGTVLGMRRSEVRKQFNEIVEFSGVERFLDTPIKRYSEGMRLRLAFAVAAHLEPPIVVIDEVLAVGDAAFRDKCMGKMADMSRSDRTVLFVSHDLGAIAKLCTRAIWLEGGRLQIDGPAKEVVASYLTRASTGDLLDAQFADEASAAVVVQRVTVRDARMRDILTSPQRGQAFTIEMTFEVREPRSDIDVAFMLIDDQGVVIFDEAARDGPISAVAELSGAGTYIVSATIPPLLRASTYLLRCWIGDQYESGYDRDLMSIRVARLPEDDDEFTDRKRAVLPEIRWAVRREPFLA